MFNNVLFGGEVINYSALSQTAAEDVIAFDTFGLQNASIITTEISFDDLGDVELNSFKFPRDDGGGVLSKYYRGRNITVKVTLKAATADLLSALIDTFKRSIRGTEGYLDIVVAGETRRIKATCTKLTFGRQNYHVTFINAVITFQALEPFFYSVSAQSFQFQAQTGSFFGEFTNGGSVESNPVLYFIFSATTSVTAMSITAFGKTLTINTSFAVNDILIINAQTKSITKNDVEIDYT